MRFVLWTIFIMGLIITQNLEGLLHCSLLKHTMKHISIFPQNIIALNSSFSAIVAFILKEQGGVLKLVRHDAFNVPHLV